MRPVCPFTIKDQHTCDVTTSSPSDLPTCACWPRELHARARVRRHTGCRTVAAGTRSWRVRTSRVRAAAAAAGARPSRRSIRRQVKVWIPDQSAVPPAVSMEIHRKVSTKSVWPSRPIIRVPIQTHGPGRAAPPAPLRVPLRFTAPLVVGSDPVRSGQSSVRTSQLRQRRKRCDRLNRDQLLLLFITAPSPWPRPSRRSRGTRAAPRTHLMIRVSISDANSLTAVDRTSWDLKRYFRLVPPHTRSWMTSLIRIALIRHEVRVSRRQSELRL